MKNLATAEQQNFWDTLVEKILIKKADAPLFFCLLKGSSLMLTTVAFFLFPSYNAYIFLVHLYIFFSFVGPVITMFHDAHHHPLFKNKMANKYGLTVFGMLYGMSPNTYFAHHIIMHHPEDNGWQDLSSTRPFRRDSFRHFTRYYLRFFFCAVSLAAYLRASGRRNKIRLARLLLVSECLYAALAIILLFINLLAAFAIVIIPVLVTRSFLIIGNWGEHAFIHPDTPDNHYTNTVNILGSYNKGWFNVGFHIGHHVKPNLHFSLLEKDFFDNIATYSKQDAVVFEGVHFPHIWLYLMRKDYKKLASIYVRLPGRENRTEEEVMELLKSRVMPIKS